MQGDAAHVLGGPQTQSLTLKTAIAFIPENLSLAGEWRWGRGEDRDRIKGKEPFSTEVTVPLLPSKPGTKTQPGGQGWKECPSHSHMEHMQSMKPRLESTPPLVELQACGRAPQRDSGGRETS
jgi:hypothetical protein